MDTWRDRLAHAATPWEWKDRNFWILVVVAVVFVAISILQWFLIADGVSTVVAAFNGVILAAMLYLGLRTSFRERAKRGR